MCYDCGGQLDLKERKLNESLKQAQEKGRQLAKENGWNTFGIYWTANKSAYTARESGFKRLELVQTVHL